MNLRIDTPKIFPSEIISGFTQGNFDLDRKLLPKGLNFRFMDEGDCEISSKLLADQMDVAPEMIKATIQTHGTEIAFIEPDTNSKPLEVDAMVTNKPGVILGAKSADCCVVLIYDPVQKVVASIHSGRRGTKAKITSKVVEMLASDFGSKPKDLLCYLSASAGKDIYVVCESELDGLPEEFKFEVTQERVDALSDFQKRILLPKLAEFQDNKNFFIDIKGYIKRQLMNQGVLEANIEVSPVCSISDLNYQSYRRSKGKGGLALGFVGMRG
jgi:YfiH family protein